MHVGAVIVLKGGRPSAAAVVGKEARCTWRRLLPVAGAARGHPHVSCYRSEAQVGAATPTEVLEAFPGPDLQI